MLSSSLSLSKFIFEHFYTSLTGGCFEKICQDMFRRTLELVERALGDSKLNKSAIYDMLLIGR